MAINTDGIVWSKINSDGKASTTTTSTQSSKLSSTKSSDTSKGKSTLDVDEFLKLLVTQMQCQDPLEPTDNTQYVAQMAVFTQVEATTQMQDKTEEQMAAGLVGTEVMMKTDLTKEGYIVGKVDYWQKVSGKIYLGIGDKMYDLDDLDTVMDSDYYKKYFDKTSSSEKSGS